MGSPCCPSSLSQAVSTLNTLMNNNIIYIEDSCTTTSASSSSTHTVNHIINV